MPASTGIPNCVDVVQASGNSGVFYNLNGSNWFRLLSTSALPSHPVSAYFDPISDPCDRALYVGLDGRGIPRIDPIPPPGNLAITGIRPGSESVVNGPLLLNALAPDKR